MSADSFNRETARDALASLLSAALVGAGKPVDKVYGYLADDFGTPLSIVIVTSAGTERTQNPGDDTFDVWVYLDVLVWVLESKSDENWTRANAEDRRDLIDKMIADVVQDYTSYEVGGLKWDDLQYADRTVTTDPDIEGGLPYFTEHIPLKMHVFQG